ncbi:MAG: limonene-1,2-epoxide hydrolase family protein [Actinomycetota bacterium]
MTAEETVNAFLAACERADIDAAIALVADDIRYENIGMNVLEGAAATREFLGPFLGQCDEIEWVVHHQTADDRVVMNERTDRFRVGDNWAGIHLMGVFVVEDGKITEWRDFFDVAEAGRQLAQLG